MRRYISYKDLVKHYPVAVDVFCVLFLYGVFVLFNLDLPLDIFAGVVVRTSGSLLLLIKTRGNIVVSLIKYPIEKNCGKTRDGNCHHKNGE